MFNLLPENLKEKIKAEYNERRIVVVLVFVLFLLASALAMLLPTWFVSVYKESETQKEAEKMNQYLATFNIGPTVDLIKSINVKINLLNTALEYQKLIPQIDAIISEKTDAITITTIGYTSASASAATIVLKGNAATRDSLVAYVKKLQDTKRFKSVDLPISNLAKDRNINFAINVTVEDKKP